MSEQFARANPNPAQNPTTRDNPKPVDVPRQERHDAIHREVKRKAKKATVTK